MIQTPYLPDVYLGTGAVDTYAFTWPILEKSHLIAQTRTALDVVATLVLDIDYTIADADVGIVADGGNVVLTVDLPSGTRLFLTRNTALTQLSELPEGGAFPSATLEEMSDKLTLIAQEHAYRLRQALKFATTSEYEDIDVPEPSDGYYLAWLAEQLINTSLGQIGDEVDVTAAATSKAVVFLTALPDADYQIVGLTTNWNTTAEWSAKLTTGFTVTFGTPAVTGSKLTYRVNP